MFVKMQNGILVNLKNVNVIMVCEDKLDDNIVKIKIGVDEGNGIFGYFENFYPTIERAEEVYQELQDFMDCKPPIIIVDEINMQGYRLENIGNDTNNVIMTNKQSDIEMFFNENAIFKMPKE